MQSSHEVTKSHRERGPSLRTVVPSAPICKVTQFQRRPAPGSFSVERMFDDVRANLPDDIEVTLRINRFASRGIFQRIYDTCRARWLSGDVNHVLGDVHYLMLLLPRRRSVLTVLDFVSVYRLRSVKRWLLWRVWYRWPLRRAALVTVISNFTRQSLIELAGYPAEHIRLIPPPLSSEFVYSPPPQRGQRVRVLHIGTTPNKNLPRLVKALAGLSVTLVVVGQLSEEYRQLLDDSQMPFENLVGLSRDELLSQYQRADLVTFVSTYEGFGMPIVEAQAIGRPVVTSNIEPMPDTSGGAACLVDPLDVADIRRGICAVIDQPDYARELVELGRKNAKRFAPKRIAEQYAEVYREIQRSCTPR